MSEFSEKEKNNLSEKIIEFYYQKNFGSMSKSDLETFLFSEYIEHCINSKERFDDYTLSKQLGITQARVRTLKERKELKYPHAGFEWKSAFSEELKNAKYDEKDHAIKIIVQDVNVMTEVRHYIEENGWYDECSLNKKLMKIPLGCFVEIFLADEDMSNALSTDVRQKINELDRDNPAIKALLNDFTKDGIKAFLMTSSKKLISKVLALIPFTGSVKTAIDALLKVITEM